MEELNGQLPRFWVVHNRSCPQFVSKINSLIGIVGHLQQDPLHSTATPFIDLAFFCSTVLPEDHLELMAPPV